MGIAHQFKTRRKYAGQPVWKCLSCLRLGEILVMQGTPLMGVVLSVSKPEICMVPALALFLPASFLLVCHIWTLNDWADYRDDRHLHNQICMPSRGFQRSILLRLSIASLLASFALFCFLPLQTLLLAGIIAVLGMIYSFPAIRAKAVPGLSSLVHFTGGIFHFLLGYSLFGGIDQRALLISVFFALVFTAGHATQEVEDYTNDQASGIRTNAVTFGKKPVFLAAFASFAAAFLYLAWLAVAGIIPARLGFSALLLPLQAAWTFHVLRVGLDPENLQWLRHHYRVAFAAIGLSILSLLVWAG